MVELQEKIAMVSEGDLNVAVSFDSRNDEIGPSAATSIT